MQFRPWSAFLLFLGSYFPLAAILLVQDVSEQYWGAPICGWNKEFDCVLQVFGHPLIAIGSVVVTLTALGVTMLTIETVRLKHQVEVQEVKSIPNDLINYVFPYVVSFMGLSYGEPQRIVGFLIFLAALFVITFRSGQILMNPLLMVMGWKLYEIKMAAGREGGVRIVRALKRGRLQPGIQRAEEVQDVYLMGGP